MILKACFNISLTHENNTSWFLLYISIQSDKSSIWTFHGSGDIWNFWGDLILEFSHIAHIRASTFRVHAFCFRQNFLNNFFGNLFFNIFQLFCIIMFLADPGEARGCFTNSLVIHSFINWVRNHFPLVDLRRRHAKTVRDSSPSYKIDYVIVMKTFLNPEGHQNRISGWKVTAILLEGILLIGEASAVRVCDQWGYPV